jgi:hypothetical protein
MAPATAAPPDPADPPVNTITDAEWRLVAKRLLGDVRARATDFADLREVARRLAQDRHRTQAGCN